jgi:hypothetical protein
MAAYANDELVLCYHGPQIYEAKVRLIPLYYRFYFL